MKAIRSPIWSYTDGKRSIQRCSLKDMRQARGFSVKTYEELIRRVAALSFRNPEYILFFRGQPTDHRNKKGLTTLHPTIFRGQSKRYPGNSAFRFDRLKRAERELVNIYSLGGTRRLRRYKILRWAILQHYEVCDTPLLDLTHSLRVACSFAHIDNSTTESFVYVLGFPHLSGSVTASSDQGIQVVRLLSICPASALRPHYQEAYVAGTYPTITLEEKREYATYEFDFSRRLVCKLRIPRERFWNQKLFPKMPRDALFPDRADDLKKIADKVLKRVPVRQSVL